MDSKNKWRKKRQRTRRELTGDWPDDKIRELIYNVKIRPELWDVCSTNYRIPKPHSWQEVALQLGEGYDWSDCRLKWQNLRVTYKCNINKIAKKQSEGTEEPPRILWRFFHSMRFISKISQHNSSDYTSNFNVSDSTVNLDTELTTASCSTLASHQNFDFSQCSKSMVKQESPQPIETPTPTPTPPPAFAPSTFIQTKPSQLNLPSKLMKNKNDEYACFGNFIASELRSLPPEHSFALKRRLNRTLLEYWDEMAPLVQTQTQSLAVTKTEAVENTL